MKMSLVLKVIASTVVVYGIVVFLVWRFQERLAIPGVRDLLEEPRLANLVDGRHVMFHASDGAELHAWYFPPSPARQDSSGAPALIWFHGNGETVRGLESVFAAFRPPAMALLAIDYRGYGLSTGKVSEEGLYRDAEAAWAFITDQQGIDPNRIAVYGRSLGAAPALYLTERHPIRAVVLDSPFSNAREMAARHYRFLPQFLVRLSLDNVRRASTLTAPLLVLHGEDDWIAPAPMAEAVARAGQAKRVVAFPGTGHNDIYMADPERYRRELQAFLASATR